MSLGKRVNLMDLKEKFYKLVDVGSPYGYEEPMIAYFKSELERLVDEAYDTTRGNVVGIQKGSDPEAPSVALAAHMDQVGFVVFNIDDRGFIRFRKVGGASNRAIQGQQMILLGEQGHIPGVVGIKPGHITKPHEMNTVPQIEEMYIDIGAWSRTEVEDLGVKIGTPIIFANKPLELANDLIASPAVDDKVGLTVLLAIAEALKDKKIPATIYYIGTVEEEGGLRGAEVALNDLDIDMVVAVDTAPSGWQPDVIMRDVVYEVGKGPAIHIGEMGSRRTWIYHHNLRKWLSEKAEAEGIPYQMSYQLGGTDASAMAQTKSGIPAITVGVPRRYSHSPVELFDLKDMENLVNILIASLEALEAEFDLHRV